MIVADVPATASTIPSSGAQISTSVMIPQSANTSSSRSIRTVASDDAIGTPCDCRSKNVRTSSPSRSGSTLFTAKPIKMTRNSRCVGTSANGDISSRQRAARSQTPTK